MKNSIFDKKQRFSIKKLTWGVCSVLIGASFIFSYHQEGVSAEKKNDKNSTLVEYHYAKKDNLSKSIENRLNKFIENGVKIDDSKAYYFLYKKKGILGSPNNIVYTAAILLGLGLMVIGIKRIKDKKGKTMLAVSFFIASASITGIHAKINLTEINKKEFLEVNSDFLPRPKSIDGYVFTGYFFEENIQIKDNFNDMKKRKEKNEYNKENIKQGEEPINKHVSMTDETKIVGKKLRTSGLYRGRGINQSKSFNTRVSNQENENIGSSSVVNTSLGSANTGSVSVVNTSSGNGNTGSTNTESTNAGSTNTGSTNTGSTNTGSTSAGSTNTGSTNAGSTNTGNANAGSTNTGNTNTGNANAGSTNTGNANAGSTNTGNANAGSTNTGNANAGSTNTGSTNTESNNAGSANSGSTNTGSTNTGSTNAGSTNTGSTNAGSTNAGSTNTESNNAGSTNTGSTNTGSTNAGSTNTESNNAGSANTGSTNAGSTNTGSTNTGSTNAGSTNTESNNAGSTNTGNVNAGSTNTESNNAGSSSEESINKTDGSSEKIDDNKKDAKNTLLSKISELEEKANKNIQIDGMTEASLKAYQKNLEEAKKAIKELRAIIDDESLTVDSINKAIKRADEEIIKYNGLGEELIVDKSELKTSKEQLSDMISRNIDLSDMQNIIEKEYTTKLEIAKSTEEEANVISEKSNATVDEVKSINEKIKKVKDDLEKAIANIELERVKINFEKSKSELKKSLETLNGEINKVVDLEKTTKESKEKYEVALNKAKEVSKQISTLLNNDTATISGLQTGKDSVEKIISELENAKESLEKMPEEDNDKPSELKPNPEYENAIDVSNVVNEIKNIDFLENPVIKANLMPNNFSSTDLYFKLKELRKKNPQATEEDAKEILRKEYLEKTSIKETFDKTKENIEASLKKVISHTLSVRGNTDENKEKLKKEIEDNKEKILLGLSYINRFYNIDFDKKNIAQILAFNPSSYGKQITSVEWLTKLGSMSYEDLKLTNGVNTFKKYFNNITDKQDLFDFLDYNRTSFTTLNEEDWFKQSTKAIIVEKSSKVNPSKNVGLYNRLKNSSKLRDQNIVLGLLNLKEPSIYVISNMATITYGNIGTYMDTNLIDNNKDEYERQLQRVKGLIEKAGDQQANFIDSLYKMTKEENRNNLETNRLIVDTMKKYSSNQYLDVSATWSKEFGDEADKGVRNFLTPLDLYLKYTSRIGAEANGDGVRYVIDRVLDDRGSATYSHEMTHLLDRTVWFNNYGRRDGTAAEFYARGIFENSYNPTTDTYFNINFVFNNEDKEGRFYNASPNRFSNANDLKEYMHGSFDVLYTLDYLEAEAALSLTPEQKSKYFKKMIPINSKGIRTKVDNSIEPTHKSESIVALNVDEAKELTTLDSLIDHNILVSRYLINGFNAIGDVSANGYYTVDMFDTIYATATNSLGMSGDISFRKQAFELLAGLGYNEGFVPYVSNQYKQEAQSQGKPLSDEFIFKKILPDGDYSKFKKKEFKNRIDNISKLKPITINFNGKDISIDNVDTLRALMKEAVNSEMKQINLNNTTAIKKTKIDTDVQKLKWAVYKAYLKESNDFRTSIYE